MRENKNAIQAFKRLLQVAWSEQDYSYEMIAFDKIGK